MTPKTYFDENNLWDLGRLKEFADHHQVYCITSPKYPNLVMLHYRDDCQFDNTWTAFAKMCRGLIVDMQTQTVVAYPFDKFFNMGQMPETSYENIVKLGKFEVSEKLDGSMIILFVDPRTGKFATTTKGSFDSEHGVYALNFIPKIFDTFPDLVGRYTFMFELLSPKFQIVVDYKKKPGYPEGLYLIGIRDNQLNVVWEYSEVQRWAKTFDIPTFKTYDFESLDALIEKSKTLPVLEEGYVLRYKDGPMVKIKGPEYLRVHRFLSRLSDKYLIESLITGDAKLLIDLAPEEYRQDIIDKIAYYNRVKVETINECYTLLAQAPKDSRKEFAMWVKSTVRQALHGFMFQVFDNKTLKDAELFRWIGIQEKASTATRI